MAYGPFEPGKIIGRGNDDLPLMKRWILFRVPWLGIYIHKFYRSDYEMALHDHPWPFVTIILKNGYLEEFGTGLSPLGHAFIPPNAADRNRAYSENVSWPEDCCAKRYRDPQTGLEHTLVARSRRHMTPSTGASGAALGRFSTDQRRGGTASSSRTS